MKRFFKRLLPVAVSFVLSAFFIAAAPLCASCAEISEERSSADFDESRIHTVVTEEAKYIYDSETHEKKYAAKVKKTVYSHTPNLSDDGTRSGNYEHGYKNTDVITLSGAMSLNIKLTYGGESGADWVSIWEGAHPEYTADKNSSSGYSYNYADPKYSVPFNTIEFNIDGDSVTFAFESDNSGYGDGKAKGYGYYAVITSNDELEEVYSTETVDLTFTQVAATAPTCENDGTPAGLLGSDGLYYSKVGNVYTQVFPEAVSATGHDWNPEIVYEWSNDNSQCHAVQLCKNDANHKRIRRSVDSVIETNSSSRTVTYTAAFTSATKYSHTANISDEGLRSGNYDNNLNTKDVVTIPGAERLHVELTYGTESGTDILYVFQGDYSGEINNKLSSGYAEKCMGGNNTKTTYDFYITGDTATFAFVSDNDESYYGYYAVITNENKTQTKTLNASDLCTITWKNYDGATLETDHNVEKGTYPTFNGEIPTKVIGDRNRYAFAGWTDGNNTYGVNDQLPAVTGDVTYTAVFNIVGSSLYAGHSLTLSGDIGVCFYLDLSQAEVATGASVHFTWAENGSYDHTITSADHVDNQGYKVGVYVPAAQMSQKIKAHVTINNEVQSETNEYSVKDYACTLISALGTDEKLVNLLKATLDYGAKSQTVFGSDAELANVGIDYKMGSVTAADFEEAINSGNSGLLRSDMTDTADLGLSYYGTTVVYLSKTTLRHYYTITDEEKFNNVKESANFTYYDRKNPYIYFEKNDISACNLDSYQQFSIGTKTYNYSVLDYAKTAYTSDKTDDANKELAAAVYWYNHYANIYVSDN